MKALYILIGLLVFNLSITSHAQISVFDIVEDAKKERSDATDAAEEDTDKKAMEEGMQQFFKSVSGMSDGSMVENCLQLMANHAHQLAELQDKIEKTNDCKKKKELLEYQSLLVLSAGTKIYCPEELYSDPIEYGKEISEYFRLLFVAIRSLSCDGCEDILMNRDIMTDKIDEVLRSNPKEAIEKLGRTLLKFRNADQKFGNPYKEDLINEYALFLVFLYPDSKEMRLVEWNLVINYFTYFLSPEFMAKRAGEIDSMRRSLPCN